jgi:hypothetical protein
MIGVDVIGRMGNQMFQYAFALVAAHKINTRFFLKYYHYPITIDKYFELPGFNRHLNKMANKIFYLVTGHFKCIEEGKLYKSSDFVEEPNRQYSIQGIFPDRNVF